VDNRLLADWCSGHARAAPEIQALIAPILESMAELVMDQGWLPKFMSQDWVQWRPRARNTEADAVANLAMDQRSSSFYIAPAAQQRFSLDEVSLQAWSDGGHRRSGVSAAGALVKAWRGDRRQPVLVAAAARWLPEESCDSVQAEVEGLALAMRLLAKIVGRRKLDPASMVEILRDNGAAVMNTSVV